MRQIALIAIALAVVLSGCGTKKARASVVRPIGAVEVGVASWYGHPYHGRAAANGEIYDMEKMTAAHRTLPFGTWVRVSNMANGKAVEVRIIDRGPFVDGRIIDISRAAARAIDMIGPGTAKVRMQVIGGPEIAPTMSVRYAVQVGAFQNRGHAERLRRNLEARYGTARLVAREGKPRIWRVLIGREASPEAANALAERVRSDANSDATEPFVVRLDTDSSGDRI